MVSRADGVLFAGRASRGGDGNRTVESQLKQHLIGAAVLVALAVIFLPMLVKGPAPDSGVSDVSLKVPEAPQGEYETRDLPLVVPEQAPEGGVVGLQAPDADGDALPTVDTTTAPSARDAPKAGDFDSSEERRVGKEFVSTCRTRLS